MRRELSLEILKFRTTGAIIYMQEDETIIIIYLLQNSDNNATLNPRI